MTWTQGDWDLHSQFVRYSHWDQHDSSLGGSSFSWQGYHLLNPKVGSDFSAPEKVTRSSTLFGNRRQQSCLDHISSVSSSLSFVSSVPKIPPGAHRTWCSSDHLPEELFSGKRFLSLQRDSKDREREKSRWGPLNLSPSLSVNYINNGFLSTYKYKLTSGCIFLRSLYSSLF